MDRIARSGSQADPLRKVEDCRPLDTEAVRRLAVHGPNELQAIERTSPWHTLAAQFKNVMIVILLVGLRSSPGSSATRSRPWSSR